MKGYESHQPDDAGDHDRVAEGHAQHRDRQRPEADGVLSNDIALIRQQVPADMVSATC